jgi:hypothetical protein
MAARVDVMKFFSDRRWINPSQPRWLQYATWLTYWSAFWAFVNAIDGGTLAPSTPGRRFILTIFALATIPLAVLGGSDMAMGKRRGYYMCIAVAFLPFVSRFATYVGLSGPLEVMRATLFPVYAESLSSLLNFAFEVFLIFCLFHQESRRYARIWLED